MAAVAGTSGISGQMPNNSRGDGDSTDGGGDDPGGGDVGGKGITPGTAPTSWRLTLVTKGRGKAVTTRASGPASSVQQSFSIPHPEAIALSSHTNIGADGSIVDSTMTAQFEFLGDDGVPCGASAAMSIDADGTATHPSWLDSTKSEIITWRE
jgi:hypothetical protein